MEVHIGKEIEKRLEESGMKPGEFAKKINTGPRNIYTIFKRKDVNAGQLKKISEALHFDFFSFYRQEFYTEKFDQGPEKWITKQRQSISILVELDGLEDSLNAWIGKLERINKAL